MSASPSTGKSAPRPSASRPCLYTADASIEALQLRHVVATQHRCFVQGETLRSMIEGKPRTSFPQSRVLRQQHPCAVDFRCGVGGVSERLMILPAHSPWRFIEHLQPGARVETPALHRKTAFSHDCKSLVLAVYGRLSVNIVRMDGDKSHGAAGFHPMDRTLMMLMNSSNPDIVAAIDPASGVAQGPVVGAIRHARDATAPEE